MSGIATDSHLPSDFKIVFAGPVGVGKTSAIEALSDVEVISTNERASDVLKVKMERTTVALDYGIINLEDGGRVHLYGTPGRRRFDFMWDILVKGGIGLILLIDNTGAEPFEDLRFFLQSYRDYVEETRMVVGVTHMDIDGKPGVREYQQHLVDSGLGYKVPVFEVDARVKRDVAILVETLLKLLDPTLTTE